jgi:membrane protease YdiL (CAAX protease family)
MSFDYKPPVAPEHAPEHVVEDLDSFQFEPPVDPPAAVEIKEAPRWRHGMALFILLGFISLIAWASYFMSGNTAATTSVLPSTTSELFLQTTLELFLFGMFLGTAWLFSRANADEMFLRWRGTWQNWALGFAYSFVLRFVVLGFLIVVIIGALISGIKPNQITDFIKSFSPSPERMVSTQALANDPVYRFVMVTWVSFVIAGLREEMWRVAVIASFTKLLTPRFSVRGAQIFAVIVSSLFFGAAHYIQGWIAVGMTAVIGVALGAITLTHRSIWPAVIAHGFFDALTFLMLPLVKHLKM